MKQNKNYKKIDKYHNYLTIIIADKRDYTICIIGADECWEEYMVIVIINKYNNLVCGEDVTS